MIRKRSRTRLAKAELAMHMAVNVERWARMCEGTEPGTLPFDKWPADDAMVALARTYGLTPTDLARLCRRLAQEIENKAMRNGYDEHWEAS